MLCERCFHLGKYLCRVSGGEIRIDTREVNYPCSIRLRIELSANCSCASLVPGLFQNPGCKSFKKAGKIAVSHELPCLSVLSGCDHIEDKHTTVIERCRIDVARASCLLLRGSELANVIQ